MTTTANSPKTSENRLRKVAIVLQSMEPHIADRMLEQFDAQTAAEIRQWLMSLPEISPEEEQAVIREFLGKDSRSAHAGDSSGHADQSAVSLELTGSAPTPKRHRESSSASTHASTQAAAVDKPFAKLKSARPELLTEFLQTEHPQVIAVVLSNVAATTAAEVIRNLPEQLRGDVLARIGRMQAIDRIVLDRIEDELAQRLSAKLEEESGEEPGEKTLAAILAASPAAEHAQLARQLRAKSPSLADRVEQRIQVGQHPGEKYSDAQYSSDSPLAAANRVEIHSSAATRVGTHRSGKSFPFAELIKLDDRTLAGVLARCEPKVLIIALAGAEPKLVDRICNRLNRSQARQLRMRVNSPGPLAIADVEEAQRRVVAQAEAMLAPKQQSQVA